MLSLLATHDKMLWAAYRAGTERRPSIADGGDFIFDFVARILMPMPFYVIADIH